MKGEEEKGERRIALPPLDDSPDVVYIRGERSRGGRRLRRIAPWLHA